MLNINLKDKWNFNSKEDDKVNCVIIENVMNGLVDEDKRMMIQKKDRKKMQIEFIEERNDIIYNMILDKVKKRKINVLLNKNKIIFSFFINQSKSISSLHYFILHNDIIILKYNKYHYHINYEQLYYNIIYKKDIIAFICNMNDSSVIILNKDLQLVSIHKDNSISILHKKLQIDRTLLLKGEIASRYSSYYNYNDKTFVLLSKRNIFLFEYTTNQLISYIDISFSSSPYSIKMNSSLYFVSKENIIYRITPSKSTKKSTLVSLFSDITLNITNEKYKELIELIRVLLADDAKNNKDISKDERIKNIFLSNDIVSYVENLSQVISKENVFFFINFNANSSKLQCIILYCVINHKYELIHKLFSLLSTADYILFKEYITEFITEIFNDDYNIDDILNIVFNNI